MMALKANISIGWTAGKHLDGKNVAGSYSALVVCETGPPFAGGFYILPQYHKALDLRQGQSLTWLPCSHVFIKELF
jgi:hypothetical protein